MHLSRQLKAVELEQQKRQSDSKVRFTRFLKFYKFPIIFDITGPFQRMDKQIGLIIHDL